MLRDAARFTRGHPRTANIVKQRGLAVVDVSHDGDHRGPRLQRRVMMRRIVNEGIGIVKFGGKGLVAHFLDDNHRRFLIQYLVDRYLSLIHI